MNEYGAVPPKTEARMDPVWLPQVACWMLNRMVMLVCAVAYNEPKATSRASKVRVMGGKFPVV
jgi:hypothetical protein